MICLPTAASSQKLRRSLRSAPVQSLSTVSPRLNNRLLFPALSLPSVSINLSAVCFSRDSPGSSGPRQTAESVGNLTQHKLCCEAEVSQSGGRVEEPGKSAKAFFCCFFLFSFDTNKRMGCLMLLQSAVLEGNKVKTPWHL